MANTPKGTLRDGSLKATIWPRESEKGTFYTVNLSRSYRDDEGHWQETQSFTGTQLLRAARLAERAYDLTVKLRAQDRQTATQGKAS